MSIYPDDIKIYKWLWWGFCFPNKEGLMKDLVDLLKEEATCGLCEESWSRCECFARIIFGDDYLPPEHYERHENRVNPYAKYWHK